MYDLTLLHKGLLLRSEQELSTLVKQSNNQEALKLHNDISNIIGQIKNANDGFEQDSLSYIRLQEWIPDFAKSSNHLIYRGMM